MTPEHEARIIALCERIGMPWERVADRDEVEHPWDGRALNLAYGSAFQHHHAESDIVHDVAHWLVAAPERRAEPDFGLDWMAAFITQEPGGPDDVREEMHASMLGILLERAMGMDWRYTWEFHSWDIDGWLGVRPAIRALRQRGLILGLTPTCLLDAPSSTPRRQSLKAPPPGAQ